MKFILLKTDRITLRLINQEVMDFVFKTYSDDELAFFLGMQSHNELEKEKTKYWKGLSTFNRTFLYFHILDKKTGVNMGWCGFHTWAFEHHRAELGYVLSDEQYMGKGIMSEVIPHVIKFGFEEMKLNRIEALVGRENKPSLRILTKMNFTKEGLMREHYVRNGIAEDSWFFHCYNRISIRNKEI